MNERYVIIANEKFSKPISKKEAIEKVKQYSNEGISAYIISEDEAKRVKTSKFNYPTWED